MKNKIFLGVKGVKRVKGVKTIAFLFLSLLMILQLSSCYNKENRAVSYTHLTLPTKA